MLALALLLSSPPDMPAPVERLPIPPGSCPQVDLYPGDIVPPELVGEDGLLACSGVVVEVTVVDNYELTIAALTESRQLLANSYDQWARLEMERDFYRDNRETGLVSHPGFWMGMGALVAVAGMLGYQWADREVSP